MARQKNITFKRNLNEGIFSVKAVTGNSITQIEIDIGERVFASAAAVNRWRQGFVPVHTNQTEFLANV